MKKYLIILVVFLLLPFGLRHFPAEENPAEMIREQMGFVYGSTVTTEFKAYKETVTEEYVRTTIPLMGMEVYLPKNFVDETLMHDLLNDNLVKEDPYNKSYIIDFTNDQDRGVVEFISRRPNDGMLYLYSCPISADQFESGKTATLEDIYPSYDKSDLNGITFECIDYGHGEGYIHLIKQACTISRTGLTEEAFLARVRIYTPGKYYEINLYDVEGRVASKWGNDGNRLDTFINYATKAKIID